MVRGLPVAPLTVIRAVPRPRIGIVESPTRAYIGYSNSSYSIKRSKSLNTCPSAPKSIIILFLVGFSIPKYAAPTIIPLTDLIDIGAS